MHSRFLSIVFAGYVAALGYCLEASNQEVRHIATELSESPSLDGKVLGDPVWKSVSPISNFVQLRPDNGSPATRRTDVFIGFTDTSLHIAFVCYEDDINNIVVSPDGGKSDSVAVVLDTFGNGRTGFMFSTNPIGAVWDGAIAGGDVGWNWSTTWEVKSLRTPFGWSAEMNIPFRSLRYGRGAIQSWRANFARVTRSNNEVSYWSHVPPQFSMFRLTLAGHIESIRVPPMPRNLQLTPYVRTGGVQSDLQHDERESATGFDFKYSLTPSLTLDATYNTDFAQVESDQLRVNLGRYGLYFPETRPFFLENLSLFTVGVPWQTQLFHSRRIGIAPDGKRLRIDGGIRLTGKIDHQTNLGFLHIRAASTDHVASNDYTVLRVSKDLANRSSVGFLGTNRQDNSSSGQTIGINASVGIGNLTDVFAFVAKTESDAFSSDQHAFNLYARHSSPTWKYDMWIHEVGAGFNPEVGFVSHSNMRSMGGTLHYTHKIEDFAGLKEWNQYYTINVTRNLDGYLENGLLHLELWPVWDNGADAWTAIEFQREGVRHPFNILGTAILPGDYNTKRFIVAGSLPSTNRFRGQMFLSKGGFFHGNIFNASVSLSYQKDEALNLVSEYSHRRIKFPSESRDSTADIGRIGFAYSLGAKSGFHLMVQHNRIDKIWAANARYSWNRTANSGLYVVYTYYNDRSGLDGQKHQEIVLKYSHTFALIK